MDGTAQTLPAILQMHHEDFPARFLRDLGAPGEPPISSTALVNTGTDPLYQPVQRMLNIALVEVNCTCLQMPPLDPRRIVSSGVVVRRAVRKAGANGGAAWDDVNTMAAWARDAKGRMNWVELSSQTQDLDPDPARRPQLQSGDAEVDKQLAALTANTVLTESTSPAFAAPPVICSALGRTVVYAVIPTASSEVSDVAPASPPNIDQTELLKSLPALLRSSEGGVPVTAPVAGYTVDANWMSDEYLNALFPPTPASVSSGVVSPLQVDGRVAQFKMFSLALRMLHSVFGAFDETAEGNAILTLLNQHYVMLGSPYNFPMEMGGFYLWGKQTLIDYDPYANGTPAPTLPMPIAWDALSNNDEAALLAAMNRALAPKAQQLFAPQGRFQDDTRMYRLRVFFRIKPENPDCPTKLVWSEYSEPFRIAAWHESSQRAHPPIPLPDPARAIKSAKPNCAFHVPANLMNAMQGTTMKGLMAGGGGTSSGLNLDWICGFNIPLITICAFFVLNIFLILLNIVFFWLPFIKICIPFPSSAAATPDRGTP